jgi:hypothetical protein
MPQTLVADARDLPRTLSALEGSRPTWLSDGDADDFRRALAATGGTSAFDKIVFLTDHHLAGLPAAVDEIVIEGGTNLGITSFTLRRNPNGEGVVAFVEIYNGTDDYRQASVLIDDEFSRTTIDLLLGPGETAPYVVPFPLSRGTRFTATIASDDDYPPDDVRYAALPRIASLGVRWIGQEDRFLLAALESVLPVHQVVDDEPADLTVVYDTSLPSLPGGNLLLVHSTVAGLFSLGTATVQGTPIVEDPDSPLLDGVEPGDLYVERLPSLTSALPLNVLLSLDGQPLLAEVAATDRTVLLLAADLGATNLPITVDFPILIRNLVASFTRPTSEDAVEWNVVGAPVSLSDLGARSIVDPMGDPVSIQPQQKAFFPEIPGQYAIDTSRGEFPLAVNVAASESLVYPELVSSLAPVDLDATEREAEPRTIPLWPYLAAAAVLLMVAEFTLFQAYSIARRAW